MGIKKDILIYSHGQPMSNPLCDNFAMNIETLIYKMQPAYIGLPHFGWVACRESLRFSCRRWYSQVENSFHSKAETANYANVMG